MEILMKAFSTLEKYPDEAYLECHKVKKLLEVGHCLSVSE
jgi:hypothetical protein